MIDEEALNVYVDGSCKPSPRRGGVGIRYIYVDASGDEKTEDLVMPGYPGATVNEMEIQAPILALENASTCLDSGSFRRLVLYSDSKYFVDNHRNALFVWPKTRWLKRGGGPVLNARLWKNFIRAYKKIGLRVEVCKVEGHSKDRHNRAVDKLAKRSAQNPENPALSIHRVRRKKSTKTSVVGSVKMEGQRITIRIVGGQYLNVQRTTRFRFEVMSRASPYYRNVDFACSDEVVREGHTYFVRLNNDAANPRIERVFREVIPGLSGRRLEDDSSPPPSATESRDSRGSFDGGESNGEGV